MAQEQETLYGVAEELVFRKEETGFTVLDISTEDGELITVVGVLPEIAPGEEVKFLGRWDTHATFGRQFRAEFCERSMPGTVAQVLKYLSSGAVKGIGPSTATKIVEAFGEDTFSVLAEQPERLAQIRGISLKKAKSISEEFRENFSTREVMMALENLGLTPTEAIHTYQLLEDDAVHRVTENPYLLCVPEIGVGFERADAIAEALPKPPDPDYRIHAGILHVINHNLRNGHTCLPREKLLRPCANLLGTNDDTVDIAIDWMTEHRMLCTAELRGKEFVFLPYLFEAEHEGAARIKMMLRYPPHGEPVSERDLSRVEAETGIHYEDKQKEAIVTALETGLLILTGGPGTGKTTTVNGILRLLEDRGLNVVLTAPTGRAAQRMSEITGRSAKTIHRLLEADRTGREQMHFGRNRRNPLECDAVIVDELSMVDTVLFSALLQALPIGCRLVMVGDSDQLPPVGAGNVLYDLMHSGLLPVVELNEVFRQAMKSL
ncbi:MAG: AAA family ATPase, partial [Clostridia bacterium]|nr:AAA family ATPase [Clostridia bacterium]